MSEMQVLYEKIDNPRNERLARYQDLDAMIRKFFADGHISPMELKVLTHLDNVLTREFQVAQAYLSQMDPSSPMYAAAKDLINHLYRCRNLIDAAHDKASAMVAAQIQQEQTNLVQQKPEETQVLNLNVGLNGALLLKELSSSDSRIRAEQSFSKREVALMNEEERNGIMDKVMRAINAIHKQKATSAQLNQILDLGREYTA